MAIETALLVQALGEYAGGSSVSSSQVTQFLSGAGGSALEFLIDHKWLVGGLTVGLWLFLRSIFE